MSNNNRRSGGGFGNRGNRFDNNQGRVAVQNRGGGGNNYGQQQGGWRQQNQQMHNRQSGGPQGGGMNSFDNRQFQQQHQQQHQQQQMMNQNNQFANQLSNAVLRSSVGPNPGMMSSFGGNQDQPVVMVLPQSQATGGMMGNMGGGNMGNMGGNMGMGNMGGGMGGNMGNQNPFAAAVMNQQKPMQVIVGNLPGLNPAAFGQQVLPAYGQGVGEQNMGMFGQQNQQGSNRFGRDNKMSSDRGRNQRNQKTLVRRNEANDRGRLAAPRGVAKKRGPVVQQYGDAKKPKTTGVINRNRVGLTIRKDRLKNRRANKVAGNKAAAKTEVKKEEEKAEDKPAENGEGETADGENKEGTADGDEKKPSKYDEIPVELLNCKVCQKAMSDGVSYESHLTGKAHVNLMKILEEKFAKRAELLMCESKMCEEEIAVEKDRQRRQGKGNRGMKANQNHCKMCDCTYTVNWGAHKASVWHRVLKEFLHPTCRFCKSQFVHRKDWVEHILSIGHLKKLVELKAEGVSVTDQEKTSQEELYAVHIEMTKEEKPLNVVNIHYLGGKQPLTDDIRDMLQGENGQVVLPEGDIQIPDKFDENVAVGENAVFAVGGSCCKVCRIYIGEGAQEGHCKSRQHFDSYVEYLKRVVKLREQKAAEEKKAAEEAEKKAKAEAEAAAKAAEAAAKAAEEAAKTAAAKAASATATEPASPTKGPKAEVTEAVKTPVPAASPSKAAASPVKPAEVASNEAVDQPEVEEDADGDVVMGEESASGDTTAEEKPAVTPAKVEPAKATPAASPNKNQPRGGQNNRGGRGSPARGRGAPNRGGGGFNRGGRGGQQQQQQQTPVRGNATPGNFRGARGGPRGGNRGGARGSPGRGRGRGGY